MDPANGFRIPARTVEGSGGGETNNLPLRLQAEDATLPDSLPQIEHPGVNGDGNANDDSRTIAINVNGIQQQEVEFTGTGAWDTNTISLDLSDGDTLTAESIGDAGPNIDRISPLACFEAVRPPNSASGWRRRHAPANSNRLFHSTPKHAP